MAKTLCLFVGSAVSINVVQDSAAIGETLGEPFDLDVVVTDREAAATLANEFDVFGNDRPGTLRGSIRALQSYLDDTDPACVVNVTQPPIHGTIVGLLARRHGVPSVYRYSGDRFVVHRLATTRRQQLKWFALNNLAGRVPLRLANRCVALGPVGKRRLVERGVNPESVAVLPPPVRPDRFTAAGPTPDLDLPTDRSVVLFVGRRSHLKGIETLETAIPRLVDRREDLQFVFVGDGRDLELPRSVRDHVTVVGTVDPSRIDEYYRLADVLVHPSRTESFGRVLVEALFCGTPVVARAAGDMPSITSNLFSTREELVALVADFESLPMDDPSPFSPASLRADYVAVFDQF